MGSGPPFRRLPTKADCSDWRLSERNVWEVERALIRMPHRPLKTSDRRYRATLRRYQAFKKKYPGQTPSFYSRQERWM